jgi:hypothetical protein
MMSDELRFGLFLPKTPFVCRSARRASDRKHRPAKDKRLAFQAKNSKNATQKQTLEVV